MDNTNTGFFGNLLSNVTDLGTAASSVIGAVKGGSKTDTTNTKPVIASTSGMSTQTIVLIVAGALAALLVGMMVFRKK